MAERSISAPVHILKADGGTLPLEAALQQPVEAVFTGPAASVLGIEALCAPQVNSISLDVGGTTTDIAFWENGLPLMARKVRLLPVILRRCAPFICAASASAVTAGCIKRKTVMLSDPSAKSRCRCRRQYGNAERCADYGGLCAFR